MQQKEEVLWDLLKSIYHLETHRSLKIQFAFNLTAQKWLDDFSLVLKSPKAITGHYVHLIELQTTRVSQTIANANCCVVWNGNDIIRSWDSEPISQNVWLELMPVISELRYFTFPLPFESLAPPVVVEMAPASALEVPPSSCMRHVGCPTSPVSCPGAPRCQISFYV